MLARYSIGIEDTIVACATPPGEGAIAIIRLSGKRALEIGALLTRRPEELPREEVAANFIKHRQSHLLHRVNIYDFTQVLLDDGLLAEMHAPRSYTGEDVVEFYVHGSLLIVEKVIHSCLHYGARLANPGEFTLRAFLNGKLDLVQAEAVADIITAATDFELQQAEQQLRGNFSLKITTLLDTLENVLAKWRAALDFPEYELLEPYFVADLATGIDQQSLTAIKEVKESLAELQQQASAKIRQGFKVVLSGPPNVGKSTLLNALAAETRVLVDALPGTTRDPIEVEMTDRSCRWSICDTAGLRTVDAWSEHALEVRGMHLGLKRLLDADLILWLISQDERVWPEEVLPTILQEATKIPDKTTVLKQLLTRVEIVVTKQDLLEPSEQQELVTQIVEKGYRFAGVIAADRGDGLKELKNYLLTVLLGSSRDKDMPLGGVNDKLLLKQRHLEALSRALTALTRIIDIHQVPRELSREQPIQVTLDVLSFELEDAIQALGSILGREVDSTVLEKIFSEFCIGK